MYSDFLNFKKILIYLITFVEKNVFSVCVNKKNRAKTLVLHILHSPAVFIITSKLINSSSVLNIVVSLIHYSYCLYDDSHL